MTVSCTAASATSAAPEAAPGRVHYQERWLYGRYDDFIFEGCLEARLTGQELVLRPQAWAAHTPELSLPLAQLICVYVRRDSWTPRLEFIYPAQGGPQVALVAPRNLRAWAERLEAAGVLLRPVALDRDTLPTRCWNALARPAAALTLAGTALGAFVGALLRLSGLA
ncbi:MAG: hypothetical protein HY689_11790 [Chloroflexi bacterium]|nr:hypothetical protein [Chloroflexota bacterium]